MKRLVALLLALVFVAGCSPKEEPSSQSDPSSVVSPFENPPIEGAGVIETLVMTLGSEEIAPGAHSDAVGEDAGDPQWDQEIQPFTFTTTTASLPDLQFPEVPGDVTVNVYLTNESHSEIFSGTTDEFATFAPTNGTLEVVVRKEWQPEEEGSFRGTTWYRLLVTWDVPAPPSSQSVPAQDNGANIDLGGPTLTLEGAPVKQGETAYLYLTGLPEGGTPKITVTSGIGFTPTFYPYKDGMVALLPARYLLAKGTYTLTATVDGKTWTCDFVIKDGEFETEPPFTVPIGPGTDTSAANNEFINITGPLKTMGDPVKYWDGTFTPPLKIPLKVTSSFGYTRTINGSMDRHGGIDFAASLDTPVYAPANGRVLYAGYMDLTGWTVCIEHGFGLKTWFYHMNGVTVSTGQMVEQEQQIGLVGSTGIFTTGAHLHYACTINGAFVNPWQFHEDPLLD